MPPSTTAVDFTKKALVIVTGASKGIGRTISIEIARNLHQNSIIVLMARSKSGLEQTKTLIEEIDKSITVIIHTIDLSKPDLELYQTIFEEIQTEIDGNGIETAIIFHNAGTTGDIKSAIDLTNLQSWQNYFNLNLFSLVLLNSIFLKKFHTIIQRLYCINITSLCGREPFENLAMYGAGKASRELFFKVLALEEPNIIVLNYSPGPVDTDMFDNIAENAENQQVRENFKKIKQTTILTTEQTVSKLIEILQKGDFKSGDTIDYYDRL